MVMFTRGYGSNTDRLENVRQRFSDRFGSYYASQVEIYEGVNFDILGIDLLLSDKMKAALVV